MQLPAILNFSINSHYTEDLNRGAVIHPRGVKQPSKSVRDHLS